MCFSVRVLLCIVCVCVLFCVKCGSAGFVSLCVCSVLLCAVMYVSVAYFCVFRMSLCVFACVVCSFIFSSVLLIVVRVIECVCVLPILCFVCDVVC